MRRAGTEEKDMAGNNFSGFAILGEVREISVTMGERKTKTKKEGVRVFERETAGSTEALREERRRRRRFSNWSE